MLGWSGRTDRASLHVNSDVAQHNCRDCDATNALVELEDMNSAFPRSFITTQSTHYGSGPWPHFLFGFRYRTFRKNPLSAPKWVDKGFFFKV